MFDLSLVLAHHYCSLILVFPVSVSENCFHISIHQNRFVYLLSVRKAFSKLTCKNLEKATFPFIYTATREPSHVGCSRFIKPVIPISLFLTLVSFCLNLDCYSIHSVHSQHCATNPDILLSLAGSL